MNDGLRLRVALDAFTGRRRAFVVDTSKDQFETYCNTDHCLLNGEKHRYQEIRIDLLEPIAPA